MLSGDAEQLQELVPVVDRSYLFAEDEVEDKAERKGERESEHHEGKGKWDGPSSHQKPVSGADGLRDDFTKDNYSNGGGHNGI